MMREVLEVKKCNQCGTVVQALVRDEMVCEEAQPVVAIYWLPRRKHGTAECDVALSLFAEEWPTLFEAESKWRVY